MTDEAKDQDRPADETVPDDDADAVIEEDGTTVKVSVDTEGDKTSEQLEEEHHERILREREHDTLRDLEDAKGRVQEAKTELERAERDLKEAEAAHESRGAKGGGATKADVKELRERNIETGRVPLDPGPEEPVSLEDAEKAKEHRGRGLI